MKSVLTVLSLFLLSLVTTTPQTWAGNRVLSLAGDGDYVEIADSEVLNSIHRQVTMEAWIKVSRFANEWMPILYKGDNQRPAGRFLGHRSYTLWLNNTGRLHLAAAPSGQSQTSLNSPGLIQPLTWYHVASVVDAQNGVMKLFIDGTEVARRTFAGADIRRSDLP
ncbi:MAG: LamG domain-containing protein, partial [Candidatus Poribacteria bacterium]|nr:LamG domain-containing protein [Candidatus Poribacteria bacterium]